MRFRLLNNGGQQAADGVGNFFRSLAMAPMAEAQAADERQSAEQKSALLGAQTDAAQANARLLGAKATNETDLTSRRGLAGMISDAAMANGVAPYQVPEFLKFAQTGQLPSRYQPPPVDGVGPYEPAPAIYQDGTAQKIWKMLGLNNQTLAFDRGNVADVAKAAGEYRDQGLGDSVLSGAANPGMVAQSQAAVAGKPLVSNIGNTGAGFNQFTGDGQTLNPGMLALFGDQGRQGIALDKAREGASVAQAGASKASAASSYASAAQHRAATDKLRQDMAMGEKGTLQQTDQGLALVNPRTGVATLVTGPGGKPFSKPGGGGATKLTEDQGKAVSWLIQANNAYGNMLKAASTPGASQPGFTDVIEKITGPDAVNWMRGPDRQKFMQSASSLSEALLRAATGAGITKEEAIQKIREITPQFGDDDEAIKQKMDAIPLYIEGLKVRAGQGAAQAEMVAPSQGAQQRGPAPTQPQPGSGYTGTWGDPSGQPKNITVEY